MLFNERIIEWLTLSFLVKMSYVISRNIREKQIFII